MTTLAVVALVAATFVAPNPPARPTEASAPSALELDLVSPKSKLDPIVAELAKALATVTPRSRKRMLELAPPGIAGKRVVEPESYALSASAPAQGGAYLRFFDATALASPDGDGRAVFTSSTETAQRSYFELGFATRAERGYLVDCAVAGARNYYVTGAGGAARVVPAPQDGHLTFGVRRRDLPGRAGVLVAGDRAFALARCDIVSIAAR